MRNNDPYNTRLVYMVRRFLSVIVSYLRGVFLPLLSRNQQVCVVSSGGVATTFFMEFIGQHIAVNNPYDRDGLKHVACPPIFLGKKKYIYIYGDPKSILLSLARRGFLDYQIRKNGTFRTFGVIDTVEGYLSQNRDLLRLKKSLLAWERLASSNGNVLVLHFSELWTRMQEWGEFLNLSEQVMNTFPAQKVRHSDSIDLTPKQLIRFEVIYGKDYLRT